MPQCQSCHKEVGAKEMGRDGQCNNCLADEAKNLQSIEFEKKLAKLGNAPVQCIAIIQDLIWQSEALNLVINDLFVTPNALALFAIAARPYSGNLGQLGGFLIGGVTGAIAVSIGNSSEMLSARVDAILRRDNQFAMSIEERLRKQPDTFVLTRDDIVSLEADAGQGILQITHKEGKLGFAAGDLAGQYLEKLQRWMAGQLEDEPNTQGVGLGISSIPKTVDALETGQDLDQISFAAIIADDAYMKKFWRLFDTLKKSRQIAITKTTATLSGPFRKALYDHIQPKPGNAYRSLIISIFALFVGLLGVYYNVVNFERLEKSMEFFDILAMAAAFSSLFSISFIFISRSERKRYTYLLNLLE